MAEKMEAGERGEWQPMSSAPKDGTSVLVWGPYNIAPCEAAYRERRWMAMHEECRVIEAQSDFGTEYKLCDPLTHWRPLPPPPAWQSGGE